MLTMMQARASVVVGSTLRRASHLGMRRFAATIQPHGDILDQRESLRQYDSYGRPISREPAVIWKFDDATKVILHKIEPGAMDFLTWAAAKKLVIQSCKIGKPEIATQILDRMVEECKARRTGYGLYASIFNITIDAWAKLSKVEEAQQIYSKMLLCYQENPELFPRPDRYTYNALLSAWATSDSPEAIDRVLEILQEMEDSDDAQPDCYTYNIVMISYANRSGHYGAAKAAEDVLLRFSDRHVKGLVDEGPNTISFNIVLKAWSNCGDEKGPDRALEIFQLMEKLNDEGHENLKPDGISLITLMNAYAQRGDYKATEAFIDKAIAINHELDKCYNCVMTAYARSNVEDAGTRAEAILRRMEEPSEASYNVALQAHAFANRPDAAHRSEDFLRKLIEQYLKFQTNVRPTKKMFHTVLRAWVDAPNKEEAAERSLALLEDMKSLAREWMLLTKPDASTYDFVIRNLSQVDHEKAEQVMLEMEKEDLVPYSRALKSIMESLVNRGTRANVDKAERILKDLEARGEADTMACNHVMRGISQLGGPVAKKRCLELLDRMEASSMARPNLRTYTSVLECLGKVPDGTDVTKVEKIFDRMVQMSEDPSHKGELTLEGYKTALRFFSGVRSIASADKVNEIFNKLLCDTNAYPDAACMSFAIVANARAPDSMYTYIAHGLLVDLFKMYREGKMKHFPSRANLNTVMLAWSKCRDNAAFEKARELLTLDRELCQLNLPGFFGFNFYLYDGFLSVLENNEYMSGGDAAEEIIESLENADTRLWNGVIKVWARSSCPDKAVRSMKCLRKMQNLGIKPNVFSFNAILNAAAHSRYGQECQQAAFNVALEAFEEQKACDSAKPDQVSYGSMLKCYLTLTDPSPERTVAVRSLFESCKSDGVVGIMVLRELSSALSPSDFQEAVGFSPDVLWSKERHLLKLPEQWTKNVRHEKRT